MVFYDAIYAGKTPLGEHAPWDIERPQPVFVALERSGRFKGDVLDAGCGTGEHSIFLAQHGHAVTGVDISAVAIEAAGRKAAAAGLSPRFELGDALALVGHDDRYDSVVDCGLFDVCPVSRQQEYARALHRACRPGATVFMLELSAEATRFMTSRFVELGIPGRALEDLPRLTPEHLRSAFAEGWETLAFEESTMSVWLPGTRDEATVPALYAEFRRQ
ncbi:class I SAM-dependent methyltransferase [Streptosporangium sp. NPDC000396]|uniref:class I SAM-dependent methyltransferase n=1 Tax=Streptosporangium sp. NPDC000396 TaxID=3366185 RepID=UPI003680E466